MALTDSNLLMILAELGITETTEIESYITAVWTLFADKTPTILRIEYTKRQMIAYMQARCVKKLDIVIGTDKLQASQEFDHWTKLLKQSQDVIDRYEPNGSPPPMQVLFPGWQIGG